MVVTSLWVQHPPKMTQNAPLQTLFFKVFHTREGSKRPFCTLPALAPPQLLDIPQIQLLGCHKLGDEWVDEWECAMMSHHGHVGPLQLKSLNNFLIIQVTMMMESHPNTSLQLSKYVIMVSAILINYEHNKLTLE